MNILHPLLVIQLPMGTPNPDDNHALNLSDPFEVIVFIILPILMVLFYIFWRRQKNKDKR